MTPNVSKIKVYFDITFLGKHGAEGLRQMKENSFEFHQNAQGRECMQLKYNESTKKSDGNDNNASNDRQIIYGQPGSRKCPLLSFKFYLTKLTDL